MKVSVIAFALTLLAGCSTMRWDPADHHISVEPVSPEYAEISRVYLREAQKGITVFGELSPHHVTQEIPPGHVNIKIVAQDGVILVEESAPYCRMGKLFKKTATAFLFRDNTDHASGRKHNTAKI